MWCTASRRADRFACLPLSFLDFLLDLRGRMVGTVVEAEGSSNRRSFDFGLRPSLRMTDSGALGMTDSEGSSNRRSFDFALRASLRMTLSGGVAGASRPKRRKYM